MNQQVYKRGDKIVMIGCSIKTINYSRNSYARQETKKKWFREKTVLTVGKLVYGSYDVIVYSENKESHRILSKDIKHYKKQTVII